MSIKKISILLLGLLLFGCKKDQASKPLTLDNKESLSKAISKFNRAFADGDLKTLSAMITDNYQHTNGNSKAFGKTSWLNYLKKRQKEIEAGHLKVEDYQMTESQVEMYGNMAIVTAKIAVRSISNDEQKDNEYRVTNIWVKESDQWKRAGFHDGKIR